VIDPAAHHAEVEEWRAGRYEALRRDHGWLTLSGLSWLKPGTNRVGSDPASDAVLPGGPAHAGTVTVTRDGVVADGSWLHDGRPVDHLRLVDDRDGQQTLLELGSLRLCLIERGGRLALRTWDLEAPARRDFDGVDHWPVDLAWRLAARFEATPGRILAMPDVLGTVEDQESPGEVVLEIAGTEHRLQALSGGPTGELWIVFGDATNGHETYGGGRFLYTAPPSDDGRVIIDFNRAYNPPCVFSPHATCPLPWPANVLSARVEAGERTVAGRSR
jgi:uncharacterized protein (DUF1684 family)